MEFGEDPVMEHILSLSYKDRWGIEVEHSRRMDIQSMTLTGASQPRTPA